MQQNTHISCILPNPPKLSPLLKLDEKAPTCKNRSENFLHGGGSTMTTQAVARRRRPRGTHLKRAKLLMLEQWGDGLRIVEALALEVGDLSLDAEPPTLRVRARKGNRPRIVPMHRELQAALRSTLSYGSISQGKLVDGVALGQGGRKEGRGVRGNRARAQDRHSHPSAQLRAAPADERHPDQLPEPLAGTLLDPDDAHPPLSSCRTRRGVLTGRHELVEMVRFPASAPHYGT